MSLESHAKLLDLPVLLIDCQATGANPDQGQLLEIGWAETRARDGAEAESIQVHSHLVAWPEGEIIPRRVRRVTGLAMEDFTSESTLTLQRVWTHLTEAAQRIGGPCPTVIHFARF